MLIDWPEEKAEVRELFLALIEQQRVANSPITTQAPRVILHEGSTLAIIRTDGSRGELTTEPHESSFTFDLETINKGQLTTLVEAAQAIGAEMGEGMEKEFITLLRKTPKESGGLLKGNTVKESMEKFLESLENMDVEFEEDGTPSVFLVMSSDAASEVAALNDPELDRRAAKILESKRGEWISRETSRRLVD